MKHLKLPKLSFIQKAIVIILILGVLYSIYIVFNNGCKWKPKGFPCTYGIWYDEKGEICGGQSCAGLGSGKCYRGACEFNK